MCIWYVYKLDILRATGLVPRGDNAAPAVRRQAIRRPARGHALGGKSKEGLLQRAGKFT